MARPARMGWLRTVLLAVGAGVGSGIAAYASTSRADAALASALGSAIGTLATAAIMHLLRRP